MALLKTGFSVLKELVLTPRGFSSSRPVFGPVLTARIDKYRWPASPPRPV